MSQWAWNGGRSTRIRVWLRSLAWLAKRSAAWSQRSTQLRQWADHNLVIDEEVGVTAAQLAAAQKATRPAKPEHLSWAELRYWWATDERGFAVDETAQVQARRERKSAGVNVLTVARHAAAEIDKPAFTRADLVEAVGARLPVAIDGAPGTPRTLIEAIADRIGVRISEPRQAHEREGHERFTTAPIIAEEAAVLELMGARDERGVIAEAAIDTAGLSPDQGGAITAIATSPCLIQLLSAPAGAGKTTSLKALRAAAHRGGKPRVVVLAPTGKAVDVAVREGAGDAGYTVAKAVKDLREHALKIDARTLVVVDEAAMVGTPQLRELLTASTAAGAKTVLVGDAHQLAPVKARGGMFAQLVEDLPWAQRLSEVWRMRDPAERTASLALRNGGPKPIRRAVEWYRTHDRLHTGDALTMAHDALTNYHADIAAGKDALLMTDTWELSDALNKRVHDATVAADAPTVPAARGHRIGVGDIIISRDNDPTIEVYDHDDITKPAGQVRNGQRWRVYKVDADTGRIGARRIGDDARTAFSGDYLREHITHGYATTIHANQGETAGDHLTAGTAHAVLGERASRALAYVAMSRGTARKPRLHPQKTVGEADHEHTVIADQPVHVASRGTSREAAARFRAIIGRDDRAHTVIQAAADTARDQLPPQVADLRDRHERTRARLRADYRAYTDARSGYDLAAELPALRAEIDFLDIAGRRFAPATGYPTPAPTLSVTSTRPTARLSPTSRAAFNPSNLCTSTPAPTSPQHSRPSLMPSTATTITCWPCPPPSRRRVRRQQPLRRHHQQPRPGTRQPAHRALEAAAGQPRGRRRRRSPQARAAALAGRTRRGHQHQTAADHHPRPPSAGPHPDRRGRPPAALGPTPRQPRPGHQRPAPRSNAPTTTSPPRNLTPARSIRQHASSCSRRDQLLDHFDEMRRVAAQLDTIAARDRARSRSRSRDTGLEL